MLNIVERIVATASTVVLRTAHTWFDRAVRRFDSRHARCCRVIEHANSAGYESYADFVKWQYIIKAAARHYQACGRGWPFREPESSKNLVLLEVINTLSDTPYWTLLMHASSISSVDIDLSLWFVQVCERAAASASASDQLSLVYLYTQYEVTIARPESLKHLHLRWLFHVYFARPMLSRPLPEALCQIAASCTADTLLTHIPLTALGWDDSFCYTHPGSVFAVTKHPTLTNADVVAHCFPNESMALMLARECSIDPHAFLSAQRQHSTFVTSVTLPDICYF